MSTLVACGGDNAADSRVQLSVFSDTKRVRADVGPEGAVLELADRARVTIPPGALEEPVTITVRNARDNELEAADPAQSERIAKPLVIEPHGLKLVKPATIELGFEQKGLKQNDLRVHRLDDAEDVEWESLEVRESLRPGKLPSVLDEYLLVREPDTDDEPSALQRAELRVRHFSVFQVGAAIEAVGADAGSDAGTDAGSDAATPVAAVRALAVSQGVFEPAFDPEQTSYTLRVNFLEHHVELGLESEDDVQLFVDGVELTGGDPGAFDPPMGESTLEIEARVAGESRLYTVTVTRSYAFDHLQRTVAPDDRVAGVALSHDGMTLAFGARDQDSGDPTINGNEVNDCMMGTEPNCAFDSGAAYVFVGGPGAWTQQAFIKASDTHEYMWFSVPRLSGDGDTLVVGALGADGDLSGGGGNVNEAGALYVFERSGTTWTETAQLVSPARRALIHFGRDLTISADGNTIAASDWEQGSADWMRIFVRDGAGWRLQASLQNSNHWGDGTGADDSFGSSYALSADGNMLVVSAPSEGFDEAGTIVGGQVVPCSITNPCVAGSGAIYVFERSGDTWTETAYLKSPRSADTGLGVLGLSGDGNTLAARSNGAADEGHVHVLYTRVGGVWQAGMRGQFAEPDRGTGLSNPCLSPDGNTLALGATNETSTELGFDGQGGGSPDTITGVVHLYSRTDQGWQHWGRLASPVADPSISPPVFGAACAWNFDGSGLAVVSQNHEDPVRLAGAVFSYGVPASR